MSGFFKVWYELFKIAEITGFLGCNFAKLEKKCAKLEKNLAKLENTKENQAVRRKLVKKLEKSRVFQILAQN